jgi:hypothetical protein
MTCDQFAARAAEYLELDLDPAARARLDAHAAACTACGALLADLALLRADASLLPALAPSRDLWPAIAGRIETPVVELRGSATGESAASGARRVQRTRRVWLGLAAAGLVAITATVTHELTTRASAGHASPVRVASTAPTTAQPPNAGATRVDSSPPKVPEARLAANRPVAEQTYDDEIARLHTLLVSRQPELDSSTVAVIQHNLHVIDNAIAQCKDALRKDPASRYLTQSLDDALDTKVRLLRTATTLASHT